MSKEYLGTKYNLRQKIWLAMNNATWSKCKECKQENVIRRTWIPDYDLIVEIHITPFLPESCAIAFWLVVLCPA